VLLIRWLQKIVWSGTLPAALSAVTKKTAGFLGFYPLSAAKRSVKYGVGWDKSLGKPSSLLGFLGYCLSGPKHLPNNRGFHGWLRIIFNFKNLLKIVENAFL